MGRNKKNDSEILVKFAREYFETEGEGNISKLKCSNFARYAEKHGSDAKAYDFRRDKAVNDFIEDMKKRARGNNEAVSGAYRTLDIDALLIKSRNVNEFKINEEIENILITMGGNDLRNLTPKILDLLNICE